MWRGICCGTPRSRRDECRYLWKLSSLWTLLSGAELADVDPQLNRAAHTDTKDVICKMYNSVSGKCLFYKLIRLRRIIWIAQTLWGSDTNTEIYKQSLLTQPPTRKPFVWDHTADMLCQWSLTHTHTLTLKHCGWINPWLQSGNTSAWGRITFGSKCQRAHTHTHTHTL